MSTTTKYGYSRYRRRYYYRRYGYRRFKSITSKYTFAKCSGHLMIKYSQTKDYFSIAGSDGKWFGTAEDPNIIRNIEFVGFCGYSKTFMQYAQLFAYYKIRGMSVELTPQSINTIDMINSNNQAMIVLPWDGQLCIGIFNSPKPVDITYEMLIDSNKKLVADASRRTSSYWAISQKSWHTPNAYSEIKIQELGPTWYFLIRTNKAPSAPPTDTSFYPNATYKWRYPEFQFNFTFYVLFNNQIL